jgi:hypothetical protein
MALLRRELSRQVKGPDVTHADRCALVFDTGCGARIRKSEHSANVRFGGHTGLRSSRCVRSHKRAYAPQQTQPFSSE